MKKKTKIKNVGFLMLLLIVGLVSVVARKVFAKPALDLPIYNSVDLMKFDGRNNDKPVYLALNGYVYDVSPGRKDFYDPGAPYHYLAGRDSSAELNLVGGEIIKHKYQVVGVYK